MTDTFKNEHIIYVYAPLLNDGGALLLIGLTDIGWAHLKKEPGNFLTATPPPGKAFANVTDVWVVRGKDKAEIRQMIETVARQKGLTITEAH